MKTALDKRLERRREVDRISKLKRLYTGETPKICECSRPMVDTQTGECIKCGHLRLRRAA